MLILGRAPIDLVEIGLLQLDHIQSGGRLVADLGAKLRFEVPSIAQDEDEEDGGKTKPIG